MPRPFKSRRARPVAAAVLAAGAILASCSGPQAADVQTVQDDAGDERFDDAKIAAFAEAAQDVAVVTRRWDEKIRAAEQAGNTAKAHQLKKQADLAIREVIQRARGITLAEYGAIAEAARHDPELYERIMGRMNGPE